MAETKLTATVIDFKKAARAIQRKRSAARKGAKGGLAVAFFIHRDTVRAKAHAAL